LRSRAAEELEMAGDAYASRGFLARAAEAYGEALELVGKDEEPGRWSQLATLEVFSRIGSLHDAGPGAYDRASLQDLFSVFPEILEAAGPDGDPWVMGTAHLGIGSGKLAFGETPEDARAAVESADAAAYALLPLDAPSLWAQARLLAGKALEALESRGPPERRIAILADAERAYYDVLGAITADGDPRTYQEANHRLAGLLPRIAPGLRNDQALDLFKRTVVSAEDALSVTDRAVDPMAWGWLKLQVSIGLGEVAVLSPIEHPFTDNVLADAVSSAREAVAAHARDQHPFQWARAQNSLGLALEKQADLLASPFSASQRDGAAQAFAAAAEAFRGIGASEGEAIARANLARVRGSAPGPPSDVPARTADWNPYDLFQPPPEGDTLRGSPAPGAPQ
jgi:hypothetical protein